MAQVQFLSPSHVVLVDGDRTVPDTLTVPPKSPPGSPCSAQLCTSVYEVPWRSMYTLGTGIEGIYGETRFSAVEHDVQDAQDDFNEVIIRSFGLCTGAASTHLALLCANASAAPVIGPIDTLEQSLLSSAAYSPEFSLTSFSIIIRWSCILSPKSRLRFKLTDAASALVNQPLLFREHYGDFFVGGMTQKSELQCVLKFFCKSTDARNRAIERISSVLSEDFIFAPGAQDRISGLVKNTDDDISLHTIKFSMTGINLTNFNILSANDVTGRLEFIKKRENRAPSPHSVYLVPYSTLCDNLSMSIERIDDMHPIRRLIIECTNMFSVFLFRDNELWMKFDDLVYIYSCRNGWVYDSELQADLFRRLKAVHTRLVDEFDVHDFWLYVEALRSRDDSIGYHPPADHRQFASMKIHEVKLEVATKRPWYKGGGFVYHVPLTKIVTAPQKSSLVVDRPGAIRLVGWRLAVGNAREAEMTRDSLLHRLEDVSLPVISVSALHLFRFGAPSGTFFVAQDPYLDTLARQSMV